MHSVTVRAQNWFGFLTTVAFCVAGLTALSVLLIPQAPSATLEPVVKNLQVVRGRPNYYSTKREEYAHIKFDLDADLTSLFNWNTKQVFAWVKATYPASINGQTTSQSEAVIWDTIINSESQQNPLNPISYMKNVVFGSTQSNKKGGSRQTPKTTTKAAKAAKTVKPGIIRLKNSKPKYQITDISGIISQKTNVTLELGWNVQPWVGALTWTLGNDQRFGQWAGIAGGRSRSFDMPALKGKPIKAADPVISTAKSQPKPAEASPII